jgi:hypothetical protein
MRKLRIASGIVFGLSVLAGSIVLLAPVDLSTICFFDGREFVACSPWYRF